MDYKDSLLMLKTNFEMRGNLAQKEPVLVEKWKAENLYEEMNRNRKEAIEFVLHDGPPYANGEIHIGHSLNKTLKEVHPGCFLFLSSYSEWRNAFGF